MCEGLGLEKNHFDNELSQIQYMAINLYPTYPDPTVTAGAVEHNDGGVINMLLQELGGLHVRRQKDGQWFAVEPIPGALVCIGFEDKDFTPWNVLILGYMRFGHMSEAQGAFDMMPRRNFFTWSTLINGLMLNSGTRHNHFTFSTILDACSGHFAVLMVNQVHACFLKSGFPLDVVLLTSLVDTFGSSSSRYTCVPPVPISQPFEDEIGVGSHDVNYLEVQKNYDIEEENKVDVVNLDVDDEKISETPEVENANVRSESVNLPPPPPRAPTRSRRRTNIA
ncbi:Hyoscyamine 6-dioxygenase [Capsicum chinense]|nr:Hyoscyamine 6-dioxygenase [Capsicum chinense]